LVLGAGGFRRDVATQLAIRQGAQGIGAVARERAGHSESSEPTPVRYGDNLLANVRDVADASRRDLRRAGKGGLEDAITLNRRLGRVITFADEHAASSAYAVGPDATGPPTPVEIGMQLLASGELRLRSQRSVRCRSAGDAHRLLEEGQAMKSSCLLRAPARRGDAMTTPLCISRRWLGTSPPLG